MPSSIGANNIDITTTPVALTGCEMYKSELALLDLYAGCGGMSTGLCLGAKISGVKLVTVISLFLNSCLKILLLSNVLIILFLGNYRDGQLTITSLHVTA